MRHILFLLTIASLMPVTVAAQEDSTKVNEFTVSLQSVNRGEIRTGGYQVEDDDDAMDGRSRFVLGVHRLGVGYRRQALEAKVTAEYADTWGGSSGGKLTVREAWAQLTARNGLFAKIGRQLLSYDDQRIIGSDDWEMMGIKHDALKLGYEGHNHQAHLILCYNQTTDNMFNGNTFYKNGSASYKAMQTVWYHYDVPRVPLGASVLFMNVGMQGGENVSEKHNEWQQLLGTYVKYSPERWTVEGSYYRQFGRNEDGVKIKAWMASIKAGFDPTPIYGFTAGYDYLSGDKYFAVPTKGMVGMVRHDVIRGFNPVYGTHHKFYGAMDFFYVSTYFNGFTPGLQNAYIGGHVSPLKGLDLNLTAHYLAMGTKLDDMDRTLGHEIELGASYQIMKDVKVNLAYSFMNGTESMNKLKRSSGDGYLRWAWLELVISPRLFFTKW